MKRGIPRIRTRENKRARKSHASDTGRRRERERVESSRNQKTSPTERIGRKKSPSDKKERKGERPRVRGYYRGGDFSGEGGRETLPEKSEGQPRDSNS